MSQVQTETQFVTFSLGQEVFAVPVTSVREILDHQEPFKIPNGPEYLLGLLNVRGQGVPVIDLRLRFGMSKTEKTNFSRILVIDISVEGRTLMLGLMVDSVFEVIPFKHSEIEGAPDIGPRWGSEYIYGVVKRESGFAVIIDLQRLFSNAGALVSQDYLQTSAA